MSSHLTSFWIHRNWSHRSSGRRLIFLFLIELGKVLLQSLVSSSNSASNLLTVLEQLFCSVFCEMCGSSHFCFQCLLSEGFQPHSPTSDFCFVFKNMWSPKMYVLPYKMKTGFSLNIHIRLYTFWNSRIVQNMKI